jgi:hypothetical protein
VRLTKTPPSCAECHGNLGTLTSWNLLGHTGPVTGSLYVYIVKILPHSLVFHFVKRSKVLDASFQSHRMKTHLLAIFGIVMLWVI